MTITFNEDPHLVTVAVSREVVTVLKDFYPIATPFDVVVGETTLMVVYNLCFLVTHCFQRACGRWPPLWGTNAQSLAWPRYN
ncbi:Uncharacterised protein [Paenibacillus macerans]|uniref:Uncharacterized protein n=1 Tax=Paenibacillus macerans TaxID=44252 RepID=A0A090Z9C4_PAEMA|nr:hypothetical protein DJ90_3852 [Paenibacillus macerans]OMG49079.1 hypothetical protein BK140_13645 [Paenibacillus macerans]GIP08634.1 hypothetical protein J1TS5_08040 [Paenibacillus macerans]SUD25847.1 Uncharacterised protein [Paenibacillus macerans]